MNKVERAHQMYREGKYAEALDYYTVALTKAKRKPQKIALHSNRAACYLKLHDFVRAAEECTSVLELDHKHAGALMLRTQTLVTLKEYQSALSDVDRLIQLNPSSEVYRNLQSRLKKQLSLDTVHEDEAEFEEDDDESKSEESGVRGVANNNEEYGNQSGEETGQSPSSGWITIPKPKGHSHLDYSRWDQVEDASSEEDEEDEDRKCASQPQYGFRLKTVGASPIK